MRSVNVDTSSGQGVGTPRLGRLGYASFPSADGACSGAPALAPTASRAATAPGGLCATRLLFPQLFIPNDGWGGVAGGSEDEGRVSVLFARSGRAIVLASGGKRGFVKGVDGGRIVRVESEVSWRSHLAFGHPEIVAAAMHEAEGITVFAVDGVSQRGERLRVKRSARARVAAAGADMLDHVAGLRGH